MSLNSRSHNSLILWILFIGVLDAVILFLALPVFSQHFPALYQINNFPDGYDQLASNILAGNGYRFFPDTSETLMRTPGYPLFLAVVFYFFPNSLVAVKIVNLALGLFTAWIVAILAWRFTNHKAAVILAIVFFLLHPAIVLSQSRGGVESLFVLLTTGFVLALCKAFDQKTMLSFFIAGILLGMATIVKSTTFLFPAFLFGCVLLTGKWRSIFRYWMPRLALMGIGMFVVLVPWIVRNYLLVHQFVPTMTIAGGAAYHGLHACKNFPLKGGGTKGDGTQNQPNAVMHLNEVADRLGLPKRDPSAYFQYFYDAKDEVRFNQYLLRTVFDEYRKSPVLLAQCSLQNVLNFWFRGRTWVSTYLNLVLQGPFLIFSAIGIFFCARDPGWKQMAPVLIVVAYIYIVHLPLNAVAKYSVPLIPFLAIFSGIALNELRKEISKSPPDCEAGSWG